jgi:hypothetical protein
VESITSLAVNTWDVVDDSPAHYHKSWEETRKLADWARQLLGERLVLQNNGFWVDSGRALEASPGSSHIAYVRSAPGSRGYQSRLNPQSEPQFFELVDLAGKAGVNFMEFGSFEKYDIARLRQADANLKANPQK